eukprot:6201848-Pleurochrysis_carterae.AAC.3
MARAAAARWAPHRDASPRAPARASRARRGPTRRSPWALTARGIHAVTHAACACSALRCGEFPSNTSFARGRYYAAANPILEPSPVRGNDGFTAERFPVCPPSHPRTAVESAARRASPVRVELSDESAEADAALALSRVVAIDRDAQSLQRRVHSAEHRALLQGERGRGMKRGGEGRGEEKGEVRQGRARDAHAAKASCGARKLGEVPTGPCWAKRAAQASAICAALVAAHGQKSQAARCKSSVEVCGADELAKKHVRTRDSKLARGRRRLRVAQARCKV